MGTVAAVILVLMLILAVYFRLHLFLYPKNRLTVLMYHQIDKEAKDDLTVSPEQLEKQFRYLSESHYKAKFFRELSQPEAKNIIITFDDGYYNNFEFLPALLKKYNLKATLFIATKLIEDGAYLDTPTMSFENLRALEPSLFEIGLHSHEHKNFSKISIEEAQKDLEENIHILERENITFSKIFAYPYGRYPKKTSERQKFFQMLKDLGIEYGVRIGNKINYYPFKNPYEICRIDIRTEDDFERFKLKLIFGKLKLF